MNKPSFLEPFRTEVRIGEKTITLEVGKFSEQASAAVLATSGETVIHATVVAGGETTLDYFPLQVEFVEKLYAGGRIKGSRWVKRDGRPTDEAILKGRLIDRSIRPLFPDGLKREVQVIATALSVDGENDADMVAMIAVSAALTISDIPWNGPIAGVRVALKEDASLVFNPTYAEREHSPLDLIVSGTKDAVVMLEAGANEVSESTLLEAFKASQVVFSDVITVLEDMAKQVGKPKFTFMAQPEPVELLEYLSSTYAEQIKQFVHQQAHLEPVETKALIAELLAVIADESTETPSALVGLTAGALNEAFHTLIKKEARRQTLEDRVRPDGRALDEIREITCAVDVLPRPHGSAMFKRGQTQVLSITTLGAPSLSQIIEDMEGEEIKHFIHHYNMPPYASGEAGRIGSPRRREIGHGALAERALMPVLPSQQEFPYTIHVVSEVMSSNGSTSMASTCASTMSLMAAGVPLRKPVAGIAMGLMTDGEKYAILSDIQGMEDHTGDMDFKVTGTTDGVTAMQMDIKIGGISAQVLEEALEQARKGRLFIMEKMMTAISQPKESLSKYAPKIVQLTIPFERIGELIGPGGRVIKNIIAVTGAQVDVDESAEGVEPRVGIVNISSSDAEAIEKARSWIGGMMREVIAGEEFDGIVTRIEPFGCFVEFLPGREGLVHVSRLSNEFVEDPHEIVQIGGSLKVVLDEVDQQGRYNLRAVGVEKKEQEDRGGRGGGFGGGGGGGRRFGGGDRGGRGGGFRNDR